ncbi:MAG: hypothetical protein E7454_04515 [Ruminococcaceae bacterium]|nr:hypothetical protein [Oscillospiraceae bacterium]
MYDLLNNLKDRLWKLGAEILELGGYYLSAQLLRLAASGANNEYYALDGSYTADLIESDSKFINAVKEDYANVNNEFGYYVSDTKGYTFDLSGGDLGAALHNVSYRYIGFNDAITGEHKLFITVEDTFDFTEFKNPFTQGNLKSAFLWAMNDIAYIDSKWGLLDPVSVEIVVVVPIR